MSHFLPPGRIIPLLILCLFHVENSSNVGNEIINSSSCRNLWVTLWKSWFHPSCSIREQGSTNSSTQICSCTLCQCRFLKLMNQLLICVVFKPDSLSSSAFSSSWNTNNVCNIIIWFSQWCKNNSADVHRSHQIPSTDSDKGINSCQVQDT